MLIHSCHISNHAWQSNNNYNLIILSQVYIVRCWKFISNSPHYAERDHLLVTSSKIPMLVHNTLMVRSLPVICKGPSPKKSLLIMMQTDRTWRLRHMSWNKSHKAHFDSKLVLVDSPFATFAPVRAVLLRITLWRITWRWRILGIIISFSLP